MTETAPSAMRPSLSGDPDLLAIDTIRTLTIDAVEKAQSGHAGAPMALAPVAYTLWSRFLRYDPDQPHWPNRDRFVLSNGHASMLLYALLHLAGVKRFDRHGKPMNAPAVSLEDIENFRELGSVCAGHPEYGLYDRRRDHHRPARPGRARNSVGMAIARQVAGGALQHAAGQAVRLQCLCPVRRRRPDGGRGQRGGLDRRPPAAFNLCWIYDDNNVTIEGHTELAFTEDVAERFRGYGWATRLGRRRQRPRGLRPRDREFPGHRRSADPDRGARASSATARRTRQGTSKAHSDPLGVDEVKLTKEAYGWPADAQFLVPGRRARPLRHRHARARRQGEGGLGREMFQTFGSEEATWPASCRPCSPASCRVRLGRRRSRPSAPTPRAWPAARLPARC